MRAKKKRSPPPAFATRKGFWQSNHYVMLFDDLLDSLAYINLSAHAKEAYTILMQEYKGDYTGSKVICPYSTFMEKGIRPNTLSGAIMQLEVFGFIEVDHGGLEHRPSVYHFSEDWKKIVTKRDVEDAKASLRDLKERKSKVRDKPDKTE